MDDSDTMDVRWFELSPRERRVAARVADAAGERRELLDGERAERVLAVATPLVDALSAGAEGAVHCLSVEVGGRIAPRRDIAALAPLVQAVARASAVEVLPERDAAPAQPSDEAFWSRLYAEGHDGWEMGRAAPPRERWVAAHPELVAGKRALVVGSGRGHEARLLARAGAHVVAVDFAPVAVAEARALAAREGVAVDFRERDVFALRLDLERYELVLEHTFYCAIDPARREEYLAVVADVMLPGGTFVGLFWEHGRPGGPPYTTTRAELDARLARHFDLVAYEQPTDSVATRLGQEHLLTLRRR